jgi:carbon monoxide dehydrogenase subunit G
MDLTSTRTVPAPLEATWAALNDPETLKACLPGCGSFERSGENEYQAAMAARVGPVSAQFSGRIRLSDIVPPRSYTIGFRKGGAAGLQGARRAVALEPQDGGTRIEYTVKAQVGGKLAQIGSRLIDSRGWVADDFFSRLVERLTPPGAAAPEAVAAADAAPLWRRMWIRLAIAAVIIVAMAVYWLTRAA